MSSNSFLAGYSTDIAPQVVATGNPLLFYGPNSPTLLTSALFQSLFTVNKANIVSYSITDNGDTNGLEHIQWYEVGVGYISQGSSFTFSLSDLNAGLIYYIAGSSSGTDNLTISAYDGIKWGTSSDVNPTSGALTNDVATVQAQLRVVDTFTITTNNATANVDPGTVNNLTTLITFHFNSNGDTVQQLKLYGTGTDGGYFEYIANSAISTAYTILHAAQAVTLTTADQIASVQYVAGTAGQSELLYVNAFDGFSWTGYYGWSQVSGSATDIAPVVSVNSIPLYRPSSNSVTSASAVLDVYGPSSWQQLSLGQLQGLVSFTQNGQSMSSSSVKMYSITDTGDGTGTTHMLWYKVGVGYITPGTTLTFTAADLASGSVYYNASTAGTDNLVVSAFDGQKWSDAGNTATVSGVVKLTDSLSVTSKNALANDDYVAGSSTVRVTNALSDLITINASQVTQLQLYDTGTDGGYYEYQADPVNHAGVYTRVASATVVTLTDPNQIASVVYVASQSLGASETLYVNVSDGYTSTGWVPWSQVSGSATDIAPVVSVNSIPLYRPSSNSVTSASAVLDVYGPSSWQQLSLGQLQGLVSFTQNGQSMSSSSVKMYSITDTGDGTGTTHMLWYKVGVGYITPGTTLTFTAADLASGSVYYNASTAGTDNLVVSAFDGQKWSDAGNTATVSGVVKLTDSLSVTSKNALANDDYVAGSSTVRVTNALSDLITINASQVTQLQLYDTGTDGGYYEYQADPVNHAGVYTRVASATVVTLTDPNQIASVVYVASQSLGASETLYVNVSDGYTSTGWVPWSQVSGSATDIAPVVSVNSIPLYRPSSNSVTSASAVLDVYGPSSWQQLSLGQLQGLVSFTQNGQSMSSSSVKMYSITDTGDGTGTTHMLWYKVGVGYITPGTTLTFTAADLASGSVYYNASTAGTDNLVVSAFDGQKWSDAGNTATVSGVVKLTDSLSVTSKNALANDDYVAGSSTVRVTNALSDLITINASQVTQLQLYDTGTDGGYYEYQADPVNHAGVYTRVASATVVTLTDPNQIASVVYVASQSLGASETLYVNVSDGYTSTGWVPWSQVSGSATDIAPVVSVNSIPLYRPSSNSVTSASAVLDVYGPSSWQQLSLGQLQGLVSFTQNGQSMSSSSVKMYSITDTGDGTGTTHMLWYKVGVGYITPGTTLTFTAADLASGSVYYNASTAGTDNLVVSAFDGQKWSDAGNTATVSGVVKLTDSLSVTSKNALANDDYVAGSSTVRVTNALSDLITINASQVTQLQLYDTGTDGGYYEYQADPVNHAGVYTRVASATVVTLTDPNQIASVVYVASQSLGASETLYVNVSDGYTSTGWVPWSQVSGSATDIAPVVSVNSIPLYRPSSNSVTSASAVLDVYGPSSWQQLSLGQLQGLVSFTQNGQSMSSSSVKMYSITDTGDGTGTTHMLWYKVGVGYITPGTTLTFTAADLASGSVYYNASTAGTDNLVVSAFDGQKWSDAGNTATVSGVVKLTDSLSVTSKNALANDDYVAGSSTVRVTNALSDLITINASQVTQLQLYDTGTDGGYYEYQADPVNHAGVYTRVASATVVTLTDPNQIASVVYVASQSLGASETLYVNVSDGYTSTGWVPWSQVSGSATDIAPVVSVNSIPLYRPSSNSVTSASAVLDVYGPSSWQQLSLGQLQGLVSFTQNGQSMSSSSVKMYSITDTGDGTGTTHMLWYKVGVGYITPGTTLTFTAADLASGSVYYNASTAGTDNLVVSAFDGQKWSDAGNTATVSGVVKLTDSLSVTSKNALANDDYVAGSSTVRVTNALSDLITINASQVTQLQLYDTGTDGGYYEYQADPVNHAGVYTRVASATVVTLTDPNQIASVVYVASQSLGASETLYVNVSDGYTSTGWVPWSQVSGSATDIAPVVSVNSIPLYRPSSNSVTSASAVLDVYGPSSWQQLSLGQLQGLVSFTQNGQSMSSSSVKMYSITDTGDGTGTTHMLWYKVGVGYITPGTTLTFTAADLASGSVYYNASTAGTDNLVVSAFDGQKWSDAGNTATVSGVVKLTDSLSVTSKNALANDDYVAGSSTVRVTNALSDLITINASQVTQLQLYDTGTDGGYYEYQADPVNHAGVYTRVASATVVTLTDPNQIASVVYVASQSLGASETLYVNVSDGYTSTGWVPWSQVSGSATDIAPVVSVNSIPLYRPSSNSVTSASAVLDVYGPSSWQQLSLGQLQGLVSFTQNGQSMSSSSVKMYSITDTGDGTGTTHMLWYKVGVGYITPGTTLTFTAADLASGSVYYNASTAGTDNLVVSAFDGQKWSDAGNTATVSGVVKLTDSLSVTSKNALANDDYVAGSSTVRVTNALSDLITINASQVTQLQLYDTGTDGGYYEYQADPVNHAGVYTRVASATVVTLTDPNQIASVVYVASQSLGASETLYVNVSDGYTSTGWVPWSQVSGSATDIAPVVSVNSIPLYRPSSNSVTSASAVLDVYGPSSWQQLSLGQLQGLVSFTQNGQSMSSSSVKMYSITDTGDGTGTTHMLWYKVGVGYITPGTTLTFTAADLASGSVYYNASTAGTDNLVVSAFDGQKWSDAGNTATVSGVVKLTDSLSVTSKNALANDDYVAGSSTVRVTNALSDLITINASQVTQLQLYDTGTDGGYYEYQADPVNHAGVYTRVASATVVTLTDPNQIASVVYVASQSLGASETLYVNVSDGYTSTGWVPWSQVSGSATPVTSNLSSPQLAPEPFILKGQLGVTSWRITVTTTSALGVSSTFTYTVHQDSSGGNISFAPDLHNVNPGDTLSVSAVGLNGNGAIISNGQLSFTSGYSVGANQGFSSSVGFKLVTINTAGQITGLPSAYSVNDPYAYLIVPADGKSFSFASYSAALSNNPVLDQYAAANKIGLINLSGSVDPIGVNPLEASVVQNGYVTAIMPNGSQINSSEQMGLFAIENTNTNGGPVGVGVWGSLNGQAVINLSSFYLNPNSAVQFSPLNNNYLSQTSLLTQMYLNYLNGNSSINHLQIYFTNLSGGASNGIQLAGIPTLGGVLSSSNWQSIAGNNTLANSLNLYFGTVQQIKSEINASPTGSYFFIIDTIENIQNISNASTLLGLLGTGQLLGALPTDGFDGIPSPDAQSYSPITISDGSGNMGYIRVAEMGHANAHAVLAVEQSGSGSGGGLASSVTVYIDGIASGTVSMPSGTTNVQGLVLNHSVFASLTNNQVHQLTLSNGAKIAVVPSGGGSPLSSSYVSNLNIWVGTAAQLPTSVSDISQNTLYVINDSIFNIVGIDSMSSLETQVINQLANSGYLAYNSTSGLITWASLYQLQVVGGIPLSNVSQTNIVDTAYATEYDLSNLISGQTIIVQDTMSRILTLGSKFKQNSGFDSPLLMNAVWSNNLSWSDNLTTVLNSQNLIKMASVFSSSYSTYGPNYLSSVQVYDNIANWANLTNPTQLSNLIAFVNNSAQGNLVINIQDSVSNIGALFSGSKSQNFAVKLYSILNTIPDFTLKIQILDTVLNLENAFNSGLITSLFGSASTLLTNIDPVAKDTGLFIQVQDSVANIDKLLNNGSFSALAGEVSNFIVQDTAINISGEFPAPLGKAVGIADQIIVKDSFINVQTYAKQLFNANQSGQEVTKVIFTDVTGASSNNPLVISPYYSYSGQAPQFDFSQATGLQGVIHVSESVLSSSTLANNASNPLWAGANGGVALTISDSQNHQVVIDVLSQYTNVDPNNYDLSSVILPTHFVPPNPIGDLGSTAAQQPISIKGNAAVSSWHITVNMYSASGALLVSQTNNVSQDTSGNDISFKPNYNGLVTSNSIAIGNYFTVTATGLNANGSVIANGQVGTNLLGSTFGNTLTVNLAGLDNNGNVTGLLAYNPNTTVWLFSNLGLDNDFSYTLSSLTSALQNNANLSQFAAGSQLVVQGLAGTVKPASLDALSPPISVNGNVLYGGENLGAYSPMSIEATSDTRVYEHISINNNASTNLVQMSLKAAMPQLLDQWSWLLGTNIGSLNVTQIYFTDVNGNSVNGLSVANDPVATGGFLNTTSSNWVNVGNGASSKIYIYSGTVAQILNQASSGGSNSFYFINDSLENIQANASALYTLASNNQIIGALPSDGFDGIPLLPTQYLSSIAVTGPNQQTAYIHIGQGGTWTGEQQHSVLALQAQGGGGGASTVNIQIDGMNAGSFNNVGYGPSGMKGIVLSNALIAQFGTTSGFHQITVSSSNSGITAQIGVVPMGGGVPSSFANSLSVWIGSAANLPTSLADILPNTLYIINDTSTNLIAYDGISSLDNSVLSDLSSAGLIAYNIIQSNGSPGFITVGQLKQLEQTQNDYPIANISSILISSPAYGFDNNFNDVGAGQSFEMSDVMARLLMPNFAKAAQLISSNSISSANSFLGNAALVNAFDNHAIIWNGTVADLITNGTSNLSAMANIYYGSNSPLSFVNIRDTVSHLLSLTSPSQVSALVNFINQDAHGNARIDLDDTVAHLYQTLVVSNPSAFVNQLANTFVNVQNLSTRVEIDDNVANIESAYIAGEIPLLAHVANNLFTNTSYGVATNYGLDLRVTDTVANLNAFLNDSNYSNLSSLAYTYNVVDTASNIVNSLSNGNSNVATAIAANIVVSDSYQNILNNSSVLFSGSNSKGGEVTKVIFTDLNGSNTAFEINNSYSSNGQVPQFDFSNVMSGTLTVSETLTGVVNQALLKVTDTANHQVTILETLGGGTSSEDLFSTLMMSILGNTSKLINLTPNALTSTISDTNYESIINWSLNDKISFLGSSSASSTTAMTVVGALNAQSGVASITLTGTQAGQATFNASDNTLIKQIQAVEASINSTNPNLSAVDVAYWGYGNDTYVLVANGHSGNAGAAINSHDDLIKLVGIAPSHVSFVGGNIVAV